MPGGWVCSSSFKGGLGTTDVTGSLAGERSVRKLFSKEQRAFFAAHAPEGLALDDLALLGPIFVLKLNLHPEGSTASSWRRCGSTPTGPASSSSRPSARRPTWWQSPSTAGCSCTSGESTSPASSRRRRAPRSSTSPSTSRRRPGLKLRQSGTTTLTHRRSHPNGMRPRPGRSPEPVRGALHAARSRLRRPSGRLRTGPEGLRGARPQWRHRAFPPSASFKVATTGSSPMR